MSDIDLTGFECQLFTITEHPVLAENWQKISGRHKSIILPLSVRLVEVAASTAPRLSIAGTPEFQSKIAEPIDEDDPQNFQRNDRSMWLVKRIPTWAQTEKGETNTADGEPGKMSDQPRQSRRAVRRLLPPNSGIINNVADIAPAKDAEEIYFLPDSVESVEAFGPTGEKENASLPTRDSTKSTGISPKQHHGTAATLSPPSLRIDVDPKLIANERAQFNPSPISSIHINLNIPPVFTWSIGEKSNPSREERPSGNVAGLGHWNFSRNNLIRSEEESLSYVCGYLHAQLVDTKNESRDAYMRTSSKSFTQLEELVNDIFSTSIMKLAKESQAEEITSDPSVAPWKTSLRQAASVLLRLLDLFMPAAYKCEPGDKYLGALYDLLTVGLEKVFYSLSVLIRVKGICELCNVSQNDSNDRHKPDTFEVVNISSVTEADLRSTDILKNIIDTPIMDCVRCQRREKYSTREEAVDHLLQSHFHSRKILETTTHWVMDQQQRLNLQARRTAERIILELIENCVGFEETMSEIRYGVAENGKFDRDTYRISKSLVRGFQHLLMMLAYAAKGAKDALGRAQEHNSAESPPNLLDLSILQRQNDSGIQAESSLENAEREILLMTFTDDSSAIGTYQAGNPEFVLATIIDDLRCRSSDNRKGNLVEIYKQYMLSLVRDLNRHVPRS